MKDWVDLIQGLTLAILALSQLLHLKLHARQARTDRYGRMMRRDND